ncbi:MULTISPECIES: Fic family protein [unclassified Adlercreutzia]|uniref:Fic family protein n=1 Tax=unclassified Adlercreutzia TaxID=2636013 RepID=UPI0013ED4157|nr:MULTISPECIES: Fic family protein [unclassified Adlercreutzia]
MWPRVEYETYRWNRDEEDLLLIPKSRRRKITSSYEAAVPAPISSLPVEVPAELARRAAEACAVAIRFDQAQVGRGYDLPALMLRSESSSSSQIERLTSSVRNVALAELSDKAPENAKLIAGNVAAMREVLEQGGPVDVVSLCQVHDVLMAGTGEAKGLREEQMWIGGTPYSPHGASFVPPHVSRLTACLGDLVSFGGREDLSPVVKAAVFHAQFETIHPFTDGNGRTGRALLHRMLARDEVLPHATLPLSAGLLHDVDSYMEALAVYHDGQVEPIIERVVSALELSVVVGARIASDVDVVLARWREATKERKGSAAHRLPALLVEQPVVSVAYVAEKLEISERAARSLVEVACERGILSRMGNARRGAFYQASDLIEILEEASSTQGIRRMAAR